MFEVWAAISADPEKVEIVREQKLACLHGGQPSLSRRLLRVLHPCPRFLRELTRAKGDGSYPKLLASVAKTELLVLDDLGTGKLNDEHRHDLLEMLEDRYTVRSILVTSQYPVDHWHEGIGDPTLADALLDHLVHNAYKLSLNGNRCGKTA